MNETPNPEHICKHCNEPYLDANGLPHADISSGHKFEKKTPFALVPYGRENARPTNRAAFRRYAIRRPDEETTCDECGYPLEVEDPAIVRADDNGDTFCSLICAREYDERGRAIAARELALHRDEFPAG